MVSKTKFPGICNNCGKKSEFYIRCGIHTLQLCGTCLQKLKAEATTLLASKEDQSNNEYNNSLETGLIRDNGKVHDNCKVPKTGGVV